MLRNMGARSFPSNFQTHLSQLTRSASFLLATSGRCRINFASGNIGDRWRLLPGKLDNVQANAMSLEVWHFSLFVFHRLQKGKVPSVGRNLGIVNDQQLVFKFFCCSLVLNFSSAQLVAEVGKLRRNVASYNCSLEAALIRVRWQHEKFMRLTWAWPTQPPVRGSSLFLSLSLLPSFPLPTSLSLEMRFSAQN